jgi:serine phosphatase RsbU (regulator of sigma subunit)
MSGRSSVHWFALIGVLFLAALAISGVLYGYSQAADFGRHARAVETFGVVRHADELLSKQVLAARFGLLNQYDPLNATQSELARSGSELRARVAAVVGADPGLNDTLGSLEGAIADQRETVERFKAENSVLRNSVYYLPTAARELGEILLDRYEGGPANGALVAAIQRLAQAALVYNLVGDESARAAYAEALADLEARRVDFPDREAPRLASLFVHARVIRDKQPAVDGLVKRAVSGAVGERLDQVERRYHDRFSATVARSNVFRKVLYGWSLLLAIAVGIASMQLRRLYAGLELRVVERTADLGKALDALWGEMKLARKIQEALVPTSPTLTNCDVAAAMNPAEDVGGDYYDFVVAGAHEWILIGDVSGHGVPAGLVMMMCHTAVRAVLRTHPETSPSELLSQVNVVLTENIRQLGEDKYMTITAFRRDSDGTISFAGAHQDIFVYRSEADSLEVFETQGVWLGLTEHIADSLRTSSFKLSPGDVLVVHTDGITEATRDGVMFDTDGLRRVLSKSVGKTAKQILDDTFRALDGFKVSDDATLVVIRQLDSRAQEESQRLQRTG